MHAAGAPEAEDGPRNEAWDEERVTDGAWRVNRRLQKEQRAGVHAAQPIERAAASQRPAQGLLIIRGMRLGWL